MIWYLVPDEQGNDDGKHIAYLDRGLAEPTLGNRITYQTCDAQLYDALRHVVPKEERCVKQIQDCGILGTAASYAATGRHLNRYRNARRS